VTAWINLAGLLETQGVFPGADVLNGIAYDAVNDRLLVTGKLWPRLFHIDLMGVLP
jgi:glutamine cyclotransferase